MFGGDWLTRADGSNRRGAVELVGNDVIDRQQELQLPGFCRAQKLARQVDFVRFDQRFSHLLALSFQERVRHAAADDEGVDFIHEVLDDADFVAHLGAAQNGDKRLLGMLQGLAQISEFFFHEQAGGGFLDEIW